MNATTGRKGGLGKLLGPAVVLLLLFYVISNPAEAAANTRELIAWIQDGAEAVISFLEQLTATALPFGGGGR